MYRISLFVLFLFLVFPCFAQKVKTVIGEVLYYAPENLTIEQAKNVALQRAQIKALADEFGTIVSLNTSTIITTANGESSMNYSSLSNSDVKGEWIETLGDPEYKISYEEGVLVISCRVKGKAREISNSQIDLELKLLRNGIGEKCEDDNFKDKDFLYMYFKTPVKGYIAVYFIDASKNTYCILPYRADSDGKVELEANKEYIFFNSEKSEPLYHKSEVDEYELTCDGEDEINYVYVIFSPNSFTKAADKASEVDGEQELPRFLSFDKFEKWLGKTRLYDKDMQVVIRSITVSSKKKD